MELNDYQKLAMRTNSNDNFVDGVLNAALGLTGEAGEVADMIKKYVYHGHKLTTNELVKELGDVMWYIALMCDTLGISMDTVANTNIEKLKKRYPNGFSKEDSINREE